MIESEKKDTGTPIWNHEGIETCCKWDEFKYMWTYLLKALLCTTTHIYIFSRDISTYWDNLGGVYYKSGLQVKVQGWLMLETPVCLQADNIGFELCDNLCCTEMLYCFSAEAYEQFWDDCVEIILLSNTHKTQTSSVSSSGPHSSRHKEILLHYQPIVKQAVNNCRWYSNGTKLQRIMTITLFPLRVVRSNSLTIIPLISLHQLSCFIVFGVKYDSNNLLDLIIPFGSFQIISHSSLV